MAKEITVVGLGPGDPGLITREAWAEIRSSKEIFLRTSDHPAVAQLPEQVVLYSFDEYYREAEDFSEVYTRIIERLLQEVERSGKIVYAVPGDPNVGEATVSDLCEQVDRSNIVVKIIQGVSFIEPSLAMLGIDALDGLSVVDALLLAAGHHPPFPPDQAILVAQLYSKLVASDLKLILMNQYPDEHPVTLLHRVGTIEAQMEKIKLHEIDRSDQIGNMTVLFIPPLPVPSAMETFQETIALLRAPGGCPWDREQTHESLRLHLLEECYEVLHSIDVGDITALKEELGDLLLQIVLHAQIATETGEFTMAEVIAGINSKIIRRHPHVFEELDIHEVEHVLSNWEKLKAVEREEEGRQKGVLDGIPVGLPALAQANELQTRVARVGFDWPGIEGVLDKIMEELEEVKGAADKVTKSSEIGDLLFAVVNYARWLDIDPETALREANRRFRSRFAVLEKSAAAKGQELSEMTLDEMDSLWEAAKNNQA